MGTRRSSHGQRKALDRWLDETPRAHRGNDIAARFGAYALEQVFASGRLARILPGIYAAAERSQDPWVRHEAAGLWAPRGAVFGGLSALALSAGSELAETVELVVPSHARASAPDWVHVKWRRPLPTVDGSPLPVLRQPHALVDAWDRRQQADAVDVVYRALWAGWVRPAEALAALADFPRVRSRRALARLLELAVDGAGSPTEVMARTRVFAGQEFAEWEWQGEVVAAGRRRRVDMLHRRARLAVEFDGAAHHASAEAWARDRERDTQLAAAGYLTMRFTFSDLRDRPAWCRRHVLAVLRQRLLSDGSP